MYVQELRLEPRTSYVLSKCSTTENSKFSSHAFKTTLFFFVFLALKWIPDFRCCLLNWPMVRLHFVNHGTLRMIISIPSPRGSCNMEEIGNPGLHFWDIYSLSLTKMSLGDKWQMYLCEHGVIMSLNKVALYVNKARLEMASLWSIVSVWEFCPSHSMGI